MCLLLRMKITPLAGLENAVRFGVSLLKAEICPLLEDRIPGNHGNYKRATAKKVVKIGQIVPHLAGLRECENICK